VYAALKKDNKERPNIVIYLHPTKLFNKVISPNKFKVGGAAILPALSRNHHKLRLGIRCKSPRLISKLRLPKRS
jgi:hypothetical protein